MRIQLDLLLWLLEELDEPDGYYLEPHEDRINVVSMNLEVIAYIHDNDPEGCGDYVITVL